MGECERRLKVNASADTVWEWLQDPRNAFSVNIFHAEVQHDGSPISAGSVVHIVHDFFGAHKELRYARVTDFRKYYVAWGEYLAPSSGSKAKDSFPHRQSFEVVPIDEGHCELVNRINGKYRFPGSNFLGEPLFNKYMPHILDDDNKVIAAGAGVLDAGKVKIPSGLLLWPLMAAAAKFTKKSTRRDVLERVKAKQAAAPEATAEKAP
ncbi:MAG TPA: hypothetical protein VMU14_00630 [Acidimicrobiales bacterium]|nr:hypothetical protein [Acidimicrobiales bacterium]